MGICSRLFLVSMAEGRGACVVQRLVDEGSVQADARVCVTGHSLGGALAMLAAHDIATQLKHCRMQVGEWETVFEGLSERVALHVF